MPGWRLLSHISDKTQHCDADTPRLPLCLAPVGLALQCQAGCLFVTLVFFFPQASALKAWGGKKENWKACQEAFMVRATANGE
jgi:hypothetical protein